MKELWVDLRERSYPIYIGEGLLERMGELFQTRGIGTASPVMIVTDETIAPMYLQKAEDALKQKGYKVFSYQVPPGEKSKSLRYFEEIVTAALQAGLDRKSAIVALGGGVIGDLAGFAAACYMRGIRFIQVPTTVLAHDSSVGGKVAVNHPLAKNIIGAFHQPVMVLYDTSTLKTLPPRQIRAGMAEVVKHGLIWDASFVQWCDENADKLLGLQSSSLEYALYQGCKVKAEIVSKDERENDLRAILNLGHTIGHALEAVAQYDELLHGEAISIGMAGAAYLSEQLGVAEEPIYAETVGLLQKFGLPVRIPEHFDEDGIMRSMMHDKKFREGKMVFILPVRPGEVTIHREVPADKVMETLKFLKRKEKGHVRQGDPRSDDRGKQ